MAWDNAAGFTRAHKMATSREPRTMPEAMQYIITFGRWEGCPLSHIVKVDPGYIKYLLKSSKPGTPILAAAKIVEAAAKVSYMRLDSIGRTPPSTSMDELWP